jgi:hypothetical protein
MQLAWTLSLGGRAMLARRAILGAGLFRKKSLEVL